MKTCTHCGAPIKTTNVVMCNKCHHKLPAAKRFAVVRDELRRKIGLPPLTSDENTCSIVD